MGQGPCAVGRDGVTVDAAAAADRAPGVCASVMMPAASDTRASSVEVPAGFGRREGLEWLPRVFRLWGLHGLKGEYRRFWCRSWRWLATLGRSWMHGNRPALGSLWWHVMPTVCEERGCQLEHGSAPGFGRCRCGLCHCFANRTGRACECSGDTDSCTSPDGIICSRHGVCRCNRCQCLEGYFGALCEQCPGCATSCERYR